jgi:hypothetical protein
MIRGYFNFRLFSLLESILVVDPDFFSILESIAKKGDFVAQSILDLVNKDIKTNVNYLKPSDKNDDLKFINDTQVQRLVDAGKDHGEIFSKPANSAKIGRTVRQILKSNNISVTDAQIEKFVNLYKNAWDKKYSKLQEGFSLIKGEAIRDWYLEDNYVPGGGTLNSSCMRYESTQPFLDIYTENPDVCQLLILVDDSNRLLGRALLWKLVEGSGKSPYYLDRVYTRYDNDVEKFADWFKDFIKMDDNFSAHFVGVTSGCRVKLKNWKFEQYPYMDTFAVLGYATGVLKTRRDSDEIEYLIQDTGGDYSVPDHRWSEYHNTWIHTSDAIYFNDDYYFKNECVKDYNYNWILKVESVWSDFYEAYVSKEDAIELEGFGTVSKYDIITVYDDLTEEGVPMKPRKYLKSKIDDDEYVKTRVDGGVAYMNRKFMIYDITDEMWVLNANLPSNMKIVYNVGTWRFSMVNSMKLTKTEIHSDVYCKKHVFLKLNSLDVIVSYIPFITSLYANNGYDWFATEESLKCFNVDIDSLEKCSIGKYYYYRDFKRMIDGEYDKQLEGIENFEYKIEELKEAINYVNNLTSYNSNNELYKIFKSGDGDFVRNLNEQLANEFASFDILYHLYRKSNIQDLFNFIKRDTRDFSYIDSNGNLVKFVSYNLEGNLGADALSDFIKEYEYYILLYVYIFIIESNNRDFATNQIISILKKANKNGTRLEGIFELFTYNDTFPTFSKNINDKYRSGFEKRGLFKSMTKGDYTTGFDFFYKRLKSIQNKEQ